MSKHIEFIQRAEQTTTEWAGGTTTQLAIFPPECRYADRDFLWRLSSATVNLDESRFTALPGFRRVLMILSGEILLRHDQHHEVRLHAFEQDRFDGAWTTTSFGRAVDFNLMLGAGAEGAVEAILLAAGERLRLNAKPPTTKAPRHSVVLYAYAGRVSIVVAGREFSLEAGDTLLMHEAADNPLELVAGSEARVIRSDIHY